MTPTLRHKVLVSLAALAAVVGIIDAAMSGLWDLVAVFSLILVPLLGLLASLQWGRQVVPLRPDLAAWVRDRSALTGEPMARVADRAVAAQRAAMGEGEPGDAGADPPTAEAEDRRAGLP
jgi:hypothetical protein